MQNVESKNIRMAGTLLEKRWDSCRWWNDFQYESMLTSSVSQEWELAAVKDYPLSITDIIILIRAAVSACEYLLMKNSQTRPVDAPSQIKGVKKVVRF